MRSLAVVAVLVAGCFVPAGAQRVASHGGFSGSHGGVASHVGSVSGAGFRGSAPAVRLSYAPSRSVGGALLYRAGSGTNYRRPVHVSHGYRSGYGFGVPYAGPAWVAPYELGYPDTSSYVGPVQPDTSQALEDPQGQPQPGIPYQAYVQPPSQLAPAAEPEEAVTLVFKDGRAPEQIHNYMLTRTTLYVRDQRKRDIPVADLDLEATAKANRDAGVDFQLPAAK